ncbi:MAG: histidine kinase N-terminal 7TM domain-containing protein [Chloroflexota bacterium]
MPFLISSLESINQLLTASIAIMAFALLLYALAFNLRERVARSFATIMVCVVIAFTSDAIASVTGSPSVLEFLLRLQWVGIIFLPPAYLQFSDAVLATTGKGSYGGWRWLIRFTYVISLCFLFTLPFSGLVGALLLDGQPAPHLQRTPLSWLFTAYYGAAMAFSWVNFWYASQRVVTSSGKRRMRYLLAGALAPALGSYPYLLFGSGFASQHPFFFWLMAAVSNVFVFMLLVVMAYSVAFYGVAWPDRVVKLRLAKWLMRGPIAAIIVLGITTQVRRAGESFGLAYSVLVPITMAGTLLVTEYFLILYGRVLSYRLFPVKDRGTMDLLQTVQDRLVTSADLQQFLEAVLAAACDRLQVQHAFVAALDNSHLEMIVNLPGSMGTQPDDSQQMLQIIRQNDNGHALFAWGNYWLIPLHSDSPDDEAPQVLLGLLGIQRISTHELNDEQRKALMIISQRAAMALEDRRIQQRVFASLQELAPQVDQIQRLRAAGRFNSEGMLEQPDTARDNGELSKWVKDALTHYWGGPRLTESPLLQLQIVQQTAPEHEGNPANALRALLRSAIERVRPEGERRFTAEWILYNILEMKFLEGYKVRDIADRLAMSEADLYRKQRVAIEAVAAVIFEMEQRAWEQPAPRQQPVENGHTIG